MKKNAEANDRQGKVEKRCILDMLRENDCETLEELKNLIIFLNSENKRLHSVNIESLKKINILTVRVKNLESLAKNYDEFYQNGKSYKDKLEQLSRKVNALMGYAKDKQNECCELIGEQDKYFRNFFANLNKIIESIVSFNADGGRGEGGAFPRVSSPLDGETYRQRGKPKGSPSACESDNDEDDNNLGYANSEDEDNENAQKNENEIHKKGFNYLTATRERTLTRTNTHAETSSHPDMSPLDESRMKGEQDRCNERIEKIKSLCESFKNIDNESSKSGNFDGSRKPNGNLPVSSKQKKKKKKKALDNQPDEPFHSGFENEHMQEYQLANDEDIKLVHSADLGDGKIRETVTYKKKTGSNVDAQKRQDNIADYDKDIKKRLNNLVNDISSSTKGNKKNHDAAAKNPSNKVSSAQSNIMDILNNRMHKASLEHIESSSTTPKYVKYNTIHREIMNPRQHFVNQNKNSVDHIICL
ncbi:hypothetical protein C922_02375 [Plasmodium inui San Antonio 1]|uniref:Uncharacterized protein n=1 Tax=Plasmodium inui San Antonio 1 TaxID=1237626 RepID=W7A612_9APIC|nr:hypothetical protein C922_02375 [Plasmodium inui San Antonio 1]EUD67225.1 hypothetical protein C922_02375 [Plasmodium inui San Antonio 1]